MSSPALVIAIRLGVDSFGASIRPEADAARGWAR